MIEYCLLEQDQKAEIEPEDGSEKKRTQPFLLREMVRGTQLEGAFKTFSKKKKNRVSI